MMPKLSALADALTRSVGGDVDIAIGSRYLLEAL